MERHRARVRHRLLVFDQRRELLREAALLRDLLDELPERRLVVAAAARERRRERAARAEHRDDEETPAPRHFAFLVVKLQRTGSAAPLNLNTAW
jgi:hypothetical protein